MLRYLGYIAALALLWGVLTGGAPRSWVIGVPTAVAAAWVAVRLGPGSGRLVRPGAALAFALSFLWKSLRGGWDISRRAVHPALPIDPGVFIYELRLPPGTPRMLFANVTSLLPGTLTLWLDGPRLCVHAVDQNTAVVEDLAFLEERIAALYHLELPARGAR